MALRKINLDPLNGTKIYPEALHDVEVMGAELDYWGRGYADLSDDQVAYLDATYESGTGQGIVGAEIDTIPEEGSIKMPNGHFRDYYRI